MGELAKQQTTYRRDAYAAHAGMSGRSISQARSPTGTTRSSTKRRVTSSPSRTTSATSTPHRLPTRPPRPPSSTLPLPCKGTLIGAHRDYLEKRLGQERVQGAQAQYDLIVQAHLRSGQTDPALLQKNLEKASREAKDKRGIALTGPENDAALLQVAGKYAAAGDVDSAKAILSVGRGGRGSLITDPEHSVDAAKLIQAAESEHNQRAFAANTKTISELDVKFAEGRGDERDFEDLKHMGISDAAIVEARKTNELKREENLQKLWAASDKDRYLKQYETVKHANSSAMISAVEAGEHAHLHRP
jgi:hypothetical protein